MSDASRLPTITVAILESKQETKLELKQIASKGDGKNINPLNGRYIDTEGKEYFIKKPDDKIELFMELFYGKFLKKMKEHGFAEEKYQDSLICADLVKFPDGSYGLIQPFEKIRELYKDLYIDTPYAGATQRSVIYDFWAGASTLYPKIYSTIRAVPSTAFCLLWSFIVGNYSVHGGNMVILEKSEKKSVDLSESIADLEVIDPEDGVQMAEIDWGASGRSIGKQKGKVDILNPPEYTAQLGIKGFSKGYIYFYTRDEKLKTALFPKIEKDAKKLEKILSKEILKGILLEVIQEIPRDMFTSEELATIADYMAVPSLTHACQGDRGKDDTFASDMAEILFERIQATAKIMQHSLITMEEKERRAYEIKQAEDVYVTMKKNMDHTILELQKLEERATVVLTSHKAPEEKEEKEEKKGSKGYSLSKDLVETLNGIKQKKSALEETLKALNAEHKEFYGKKEAEKDREKLFKNLYNKLQRSEGLLNDTRLNDLTDKMTLLEALARGKDELIVALQEKNRATTDAEEARQVAMKKHHMEKEILEGEKKAATEENKRLQQQLQEQKTAAEENKNLLAQNKLLQQQLQEQKESVQEQKKQEHIVAPPPDPTTPQLRFFTPLATSMVLGAAVGGGLSYMSYLQLNLWLSVGGGALIAMLLCAMILTIAAAQQRNDSQNKSESVIGLPDEV